MSTFTINSLGCGSAKPSGRHYPSCTVLNIRDTLYMIDCGEGAQRQFQRRRLKFSRLRHIFLTHLHGDHMLGLPGLIETLALTGYTGTLNIHTFAKGITLLRRIREFFGYRLPYELVFHSIEPADAVVLETPALTVESIPLRHRVPTVGYLFREKPRQPHLVKEMLDFHRVPVALRRDIKEGADFVRDDGRVIPNAMLTRPAAPGLSYAHISDTAYMPELAERTGPVTCLLHEATYDDSLGATAAERGHSTARQAAMTARDAGAGRLLLTHFSSRYNDETPLLEEARAVFPATELCREGATFALD